MLRLELQKAGFGAKVLQNRKAGKLLEGTRFQNSSETLKGPVCMIHSLEGSSQDLKGLLKTLDSNPKMVLPLEESWIRPWFPWEASKPSANFQSRKILLGGNGVWSRIHLEGSIGGIFGFGSKTFDLYFDCIPGRDAVNFRFHVWIPTRWVGKVGRSSRRVTLSSFPPNHELINHSFIYVKIQTTPMPCETGKELPVPAFACQTRKLTRPQMARC